MSGTFRIVDDCTFEVKDFSYDGQAPAAYFWGAPGTTQAAIVKFGERLSDMQLTRAYDKETLQLQLNEGVSWDQVPVILVWCEVAKADFGHVELKPLLAAKDGGSVATAPAPGPATTGLGLANCQELMPGYLNLHYEVADGMITLGLEGRPGAGNRWMGFGFSAPNATDVLMPGSDAVVGERRCPVPCCQEQRAARTAPMHVPACSCATAPPSAPVSHAPAGGMVGGECFVYDYYLSSRNQCSYAQHDGVCPDFALASSQSANQLEMLGCDQVGGKGGACRPGRDVPHAGVCHLEAALLGPAQQLFPPLHAGGRRAVGGCAASAQGLGSV